MIAYRAMLDVPRELVVKLAGLLRGERRRRGTRRGTRALSCWKQALLGLVWFRKNEEMTALAAGFGISRATGYRYRDEVIDVLAAPGPGPARGPAAGRRRGLVARDLSTARCSAPTAAPRPPPASTGTTIHAWYSGKHRAFGGNVQAIMRPDGQPIWTSEVVAGHDHDLTAARDAHLLGALYWAASQLDLPTLADGGYHGAGQGIHVPLQAARRRKRPRGRSPGLQRAPARSTRPGRTRLRPAHRPLAGPATHHRQPIQNRRHRRRRTDAHPIRTTRPTPILLRSPHSDSVVLARGGDRPCHRDYTQPR